MAVKTLTYLVRRRLRADGGRGRFPEPNDLYLAAFDDRAAAEEHAAALHRAAFLDCGPELLGPDDVTPLTHGLAEATSLPEFALRDFLLDDGIDPPDPVEPADPQPCRSSGTSDHDWAPEQSRWERWWRDVVAGGRLTAEQRVRVCEAFNTLRLFEVVESSRLTHPPAAGVVFAIVHTRWVYADTWDFDSHDVVGVFPTRKAAEAELARRRRECEADRDNGPPHADELTVVELPFDPEDGR